MAIPPRVPAFCARFDLRVPILLAPMAGASAPGLSAAVIAAGGMGALGALQLPPAAIAGWADEVRRTVGGPFQVNLWIPEPMPARDEAAEAAIRAFLGRWGPPVPVSAGDAPLPDFAAQFEALLAARPAAVSSIMGVYPPLMVARLKAAGIPWLAAVATVGEAREAERAGADVIVAQGMEAGGHRAAFRASAAERELVGGLSLIPAVVDAVSVPVVAAGGIADGRGVAAAIALGASAVQIGTGFLRCPEAAIAAEWADAIARTPPEGTQVSRVFSGRPARSIRTAYVRAATGRGAPSPAPYPVQRGLTAPMRAAAAESGDVERMQVWAGQSAALAEREPAAALAARLWAEAEAILA